MPRSDCNCACMPSIDLPAPVVAEPPPRLRSAVLLAVELDDVAVSVAELMVALVLFPDMGSPPDMEIPVP